MHKIKVIISYFVFTVLLTPFVSAATITGTVTYDGKVPNFREIKMDADPICLTHNTGPVYPQTLVLGEGNSMGNVFVHVVSGIPKKEYTPPTQEAVISQLGCMYTPHVLGVMVGQPVKILNPDGTLHNVHAMPKTNKEFNLAMPKFRKQTTKIFDKAEFMFPIKCDVHPWMGAWISVMPHPYFNVTKKNGKFSIDNLPAGEYQLEAWHEKLGTKRIAVTLTEDQTQEINITFSRPSKKE